MIDPIDYTNNLTIVTSTKDNINWVNSFLKSFYQTAYNKNIPILIVDSSTISNHNTLLEIVKDYNNVKVITSPHIVKHWITDWEYGVSQCTTKYILSCHIDIIFLLDYWDIKLTELLNTNVLVSGATGDNKYIASSFILTTTELLHTAGFATTCLENGNFQEIANIINLANKRGSTLLLCCNHIQSKSTIQYGDIFSLDNKNIYYHSYYSARVISTTSEPIPEAEYISSKVAERNLDKVPFLLLNYLDNKSNISFIDFLNQN
jgi:hypothetical protein